MPLIDNSTNTILQSTVATIGTQNWVSRGHFRGQLTYLSCKISLSPTPTASENEFYQAILEDRVHTLFKEKRGGAIPSLDLILVLSERIVAQLSNKY